MIGGARGQGPGGEFVTLFPSSPHTESYLKGPSLAFIIK